MIHLLTGSASIRRAHGRLPLACVIGDISMVRALGRSGVPVALATATPGASAALSRYCRAVVRIPDVVEDPDGAMAQLIAWARQQPDPPVLFYQGDHDLLAVSRHRDRLAAHVRVVLPPRELVEDCVDKVRFAALAQRLGLPVPATSVLQRGGAATAWNVFPCVLKPAVRTHWFDSPLLRRASDSSPKALRIGSRGELEALRPWFHEHGTDLVLQALVEGGEDRIVSYHAYVRPGGAIVGEFTGRKLRTSPRQCGASTYVEITDDRELARLGRGILEKIGFSGVVKMDFKQDERDGRIHLLEINPRFSLWHHPATLAGIALPELVYRDCIEPGSAPIVAGARAGVRWLSARADRNSLPERRRDGELSLGRWLWQCATATVNEDFYLRDPWPALVELWGTVGRRLRRATARARQAAPTS